MSISFSGRFYFIPVILNLVIHTVKKAVPFFLTCHADQNEIFIFIFPENLDWILNTCFMI